MNRDDYNQIEQTPEFKEFTKPPPPPPPTPGMAINAIVTILVVVAIGVVIILVGKGINKVRGLATEENLALAEVVTQVNLANEVSVMESAIEVTPAELAAAPADYTGKWLVVDGTVSFLQDEESGDSVSLAEAQSSGRCIYWIDGPVAVSDRSNAKPQLGPDTALKAYGRCLVVDASRFGLSDSGMQALSAMPGYNGTTVVMLIAKWVEAP